MGRPGIPVGSRTLIERTGIFYSIHGTTGTDAMWMQKYETFAICANIIFFVVLCYECED